MPQRFSDMRQYANAGVQFGTSSGKNYASPESGLLAYDVVTSWAQVEFSQLRFLVETEGGREAELSQKYYSARKLSEKLALFEACKTKLPRNVLALLEELESKLSSLEKFRNKIVHWQPCSEPIKSGGITLRNPNAGKLSATDGLRSVYYFSNNEMGKQIESCRHAETAYLALLFGMQADDPSKIDLASNHISAIDHPNSLRPAIIITGFGGNY